jgi:hypothetical protein
MDVIIGTRLNDTGSLSIEKLPVKIQFLPAVLIKQLFVYLRFALYYRKNLWKPV